MLTREEMERYDRQLILQKFGPEGQYKLKAAKILIVGAGGLGSVAALYLASAGVGTLGLVEYDTVDLSNLHRQVLYDEKDIGKAKALLAKEHLIPHQSEMKCVVHEGMLTGENAADVFSGYDLVLDATDNIKARYLVSDTCAILKKPLVHGAAVAWEGYVTVLNYADKGPCYRCLFPEAPRYEAQRVAARVGILGVVAGIVGQLMAEQAIAVISGNDSAILSQRMLSFDGKKTSFTEIKLRPKSL